MIDPAIAPLLEAQAGQVRRNAAPAKLVELALERGEGALAASGALVTLTGERTGRSPNDRFVVEDAWSRKNVAWGKVNKPVSVECFERLLARATEYLKGRERFVFEGFVGADTLYRMPVRVIAEKAWHALFGTTLFIRPTREELATLQPEFTVVDVPDLVIDPKQYGIEIKKSIFSVLNGLLPERNVFPMHCSANVGASGDAALFFGLSGTGKTTLSADPTRRLIGDDEHGWSDHGVFNFEGGCYAKVIKLSREAEPQIWNAIRFGSILENVVVHPEDCTPDYNADTITENTRATYPVEYIDRCVIPGVGPHPSNVVFLTCDAFGVLPPLAKLTPAMAMYHFLSGYTAKLAGTEVGVTKPEATFSTCFGAPFMPLNPAVYAKMLGERLQQHNATCWLVNSGWSGGAYGEGNRMKIGITRALLTAAFSGKLANASFTPDPHFGVLVPNACPGVETEVLTPRHTWRDQAAYERTAQHLASLFHQNFEQYASAAGPEIANAGPR